MKDESDTHLRDGEDDASDWSDSFGKAESKRDCWVLEEGNQRSCEPLANIAALYTATLTNRPPDTL